MKRFDSYEIQHVAEMPLIGGGTHWVLVRHLGRYNAKPLRQKWTLFGHINEDSVVHVHDCETYQEVREMYFAITGCDCGETGPEGHDLVALPVAPHGQLIVVATHAHPTSEEDTDEWVLAHTLEEAEAHWNKVLAGGAVTASICRVVKSSDYEGTGV